MTAHKFSCDVTLYGSGATCNCGLTDDLTPAERIDPTEHIDPDDPRYDGFRINEYWVATATGPDNQEGPLYVDHEHAKVFHLAVGPAMAADQRWLMHLRQYADHMASISGIVVSIRHFVPEGEPEVFRPL